MHPTSTRSPLYPWILAAALAITAIVYWPGLQGAFLFDDYPNIVDNQGVQPHEASLPSLVRAALASPASDFKRPLASLSFAANYLTTGLDPYWMKLTNLVIHLLNGLLVFLLTRLLLRPISTKDQPDRSDIVATLVAAGWMLLPINLTAVLYVVQRMESMANLFVLLGLLGYVTGRRRMLASAVTSSSANREGLGWSSFSPSIRGFSLCLISVTIPTAVGILAKETAVMLPLYALLIEWALFRFRRPQGSTVSPQEGGAEIQRCDLRITGLFLLVLAIPMIIGLAWLLPGVLKPETWAARDFTLGTRLLSEARIVVDYVIWTLLPTPSALSFYHDDFRISTNLLAPWSTLASIVMLATLIALALWLRSRRPLVALGVALFLGCQLLTGTILPLELIYEHRNYFASFGLLLAIVPLLAVPRDRPFALPHHALLVGLMLCWTALTAFTAYAWGNPLRLAEDLAVRAPQSPRAQYELGRTYIIYSHYDPVSAFTKLAYAPLERSAALPNSSILPEQALIFMNARMHLPLKDIWWDSMTAKLKAHKPGVQDESSLGALTQCVRENHCDLPKSRMMEAFMAALAHPNPSARLLATYGDYAWNVLEDHALGERMTKEAVKVSPNEPAYQITLIRMLAAQGRKAEASRALEQLQSLNLGGQLDNSLIELRARSDLQ
jgi:protein O-mannosyl-transferase